QGAHQLAQNSRCTGFPLDSASETAFPSTLCCEKTGAMLPILMVFDALIRWAISLPVSVLCRDGSSALKTSSTVSIFSGLVASERPTSAKNDFGFSFAN